MDAGVKDVLRGLEDLLGAVAVVHVPVEDQDALGATRARVLGGDRDLVHEAEPHRLVGLGVVSGRTKRAERRAVLPGQEAVNGVARRAGGSERRFP